MDSRSNNFEAMQQGFQTELDTRFTNFGNAMYNNMYHPMMNRLQGVQQSLHNDIETLSARLDGLATSEQYEQLSTHQTQLENNFNTFNTIFQEFNGHFYSIYPPSLHLLSFRLMDHIVLLRHRLRMTSHFGFLMTKGERKVKKISDQDHAYLLLWYCMNFGM
jgi:hypothetical protein